MSLVFQGEGQDLPSHQQVPSRLEARGRLQWSDSTVCKLFRVGPFRPPLPPSGSRSGSPAPGGEAARLGGRPAASEEHAGTRRRRGRGKVGAASARPGELARPNLQVTPRGGGGGRQRRRRCRARSPQRLGAPGRTRGERGSPRLPARRPARRPEAGAADARRPGRGGFCRAPAPRPRAGLGQCPRVRPWPRLRRAGGVRGGGGGGDRRGGSGPAGLRFAPAAAAAAAAPVAQDATRGALLALLSSLLLLLLLRLLWCPADAPARSRLWVEESREDPRGTSTALRTLRSPATPVPRPRNSTYLKEKSLQLAEKCRNLQSGVKSLSNKTKRYSEDEYLQIITDIQSCPWERQAQEYENFRAKLASCCNAVQNFVVSQNNTPEGTNMSYEVESKKQIPVREGIFRMFPVSQPFMDYPYNQCAVVGNGGILNKSLCGAEIDKSDFVFRCNLPPTAGNISKDVGSKTNLVTVNPSIITLKYGNLKEKKAMFLEDISTYGDAFLLLPAFSFRANTGISFKVYYTLKESKVRQKVLFFHPKYLRHLALFWRTKGVTAYRLSTGLMITSVAVELCENVKLYGFWPFSKTVEEAPVSHHYYDNTLPKRGFHQMPKEYSQILQLHVKGILKLQFSKCEIA